MYSARKCIELKPSDKFVLNVGKLHLRPEFLVDRLTVSVTSKVVKISTLVGLL